MHDSTFQFRVFVPLRGILLIGLIILICTLGLYAFDHTGIALMKNHFIRILLLLVPAGLAYYLFGRLASTIMEAKVDDAGIWLKARPTFYGNRQEDHFIGWNEIERWIFKAGKTWSLHDISWDRFRLQLFTGQSIRFYPVDDFEESGAFSRFLVALRYYTAEYNTRYPQANPIKETEPESLLKWGGSLKAVFWLAFIGMIGVATWLELRKPDPRWILLPGYALIAFGAGILLIKNLKAAGFMNTAVQKDKAF